MLASPESVTESLYKVPAGIDAIGGFGDWRDQVWWPIGIAESNRIAAAQAYRALAWATTLDDDLQRDAALLALPNILAYGRAIVLAAVATGRAAAGGIRLVGGSPEFEYLRTGEGSLPDHSAPILPSVRIRHELARRVARICSWSGLTGTASALVNPEAVAVSHNSLLQQAAAQSSKRIGFRHAECILIEARRRCGMTVAPEELISSCSDVLLGEDVAEEPWRRHATALLVAMTRPHLAAALQDMRGLRLTPMRETVWSGSGGPYAPRAVGLEVLHRGGSVIRFDHGTPKGFVEHAEFNAMLEFAVSSEFVVATEAAAHLSRRSRDKCDVPASRRVHISGMTGDRHFAHGWRERRKKSGKPRVVYAPTQLLGFRQLLPVQPPDVIHLDWQMRVVEALRELPVEFVCQPHPEGLFKGRPHPLQPLATTLRGNFDAQLDAADVFVFDYPSTTALWEAACTDARIVFLNIGSGEMSPEISRLFRVRAHVIEVAHDEHNRPQLDALALRDAVLTDTSHPDPTPFRRLLAGVQ